MPFRNEIEKPNAMFGTPVKSLLLAYLIEYPSRGIMIFTSLVVIVIVAL